MRTLLLLSVLVASAMSAAVLYKEVGIHPNGISRNILGWELTKQVGPIQYTGSEFPFYDAQTKDYLGGINYLPQVDSVVGLRSGYLDSDQIQRGNLLRKLGVISDVDTTPLIYATQQPLVGQNIGKYDTVLNQLIGQQYGYSGFDQEGILHGSEIQRLLQGTDQSGSIFVDDNGIIYGVHPQLTPTLLKHQLGQLGQVGLIDSGIGIGQQIGHYYVDGNGVLRWTLQSGVGDKWVTYEKGYPTVHVVDPVLGQYEISLGHLTFFGRQGGVQRVGISDVDLLNDLQDQLHPTIRVIRGGLGHAGYDVSKGLTHHDVTQNIHPMMHQNMEDMNMMEFQGNVHTMKPEFTGTMYGRSGMDTQEYQTSLKYPFTTFGQGVGGGMMHQANMQPWGVSKGVHWPKDLKHHY